MAPAMRDTGVSGIPARNTLTGRGTIAVSIEDRQKEYISISEISYRRRKDG